MSDADNTKKKKSDLIPRLITAAVAVPLLLALFFMAPPWAFFALITVAGAISAWEYTRITLGKDHAVAPWLSAILTLGVVSVQVYASAHLLPALMGATLIIFLYTLFGYKDQSKATLQASSILTGLIYGGMMFGCFTMMRLHVGDAGPYWVVFALSVIWGSDTGAYFFGRAFGKRKLYEAVSPNKSIEGALGGVLTSIVFTLGFNYLFDQVSDAWKALEIWQVLLFAIPGNIIGQLGDLVESLFKRAHGVKDSGTIIYGHGGMLDRIDALILASPWFYYFVITFI